MPWFLAYNGQQIGPLDDAQAKQQAQTNPHGLAWRDGFAQWMPIHQVSELYQPVSQPAGAGSAVALRLWSAGPGGANENAGSCR